MASKAQCLYCFECLSASFEHREHLSLERIVDLFDHYTNPQTTASEEDGAIEHDEQFQEYESEEGLDEDDDTDQEDAVPTSAASSQPQLPSISRLRASNPSSRSSSSSTPSLMSAASSNSQLSSLTSTSTISSVSNYVSHRESYPMFVTWNTVSRSGHKSLRGCIGTFDPLPLASGLNTYAITSAFDDTRFSPIPVSLMPALFCSITLLANFEPCKDAMDWTLGTHGLRIGFTYRGRRHGATYLPDVAVEQGWTKDETIESLMRKAGWDGGSTAGVARRLLRGSSRGYGDDAPKAWGDPSIGSFSAVRYTGLKASATYAEWKEFNSWIRSQQRDRR